MYLTLLLFWEHVGQLRPQQCVEAQKMLTSQNLKFAHALMPDALDYSEVRAFGGDLTCCTWYEIVLGRHLSCNSLKRSEREVANACRSAVVCICWSLTYGLHLLKSLANACKTTSKAAPPS